MKQNFYYFYSMITYINTNKRAYFSESTNKTNRKTKRQQK